MIWTRTGYYTQIPTVAAEFICYHTVKGEARPTWAVIKIDPDKTFEPILKRVKLDQIKLPVETIVERRAVS